MENKKRVCSGCGKEIDKNEASLSFKDKESCMDCISEVFPGLKWNPKQTEDKRTHAEKISEGMKRHWKTRKAKEYES